jgi:hypothetical protein
VKPCTTPSRRVICQQVTSVVEVGGDLDAEGRRRAEGDEPGRHVH